MKEHFRSGGGSFLFLFVIILLLIFFTKTWEVGIHHLFLTFLLILVGSLLSTPGILRASKYLEVFNNYDLALISLFSALLYAVSFLSILVPSFLFYLIPSAAGILFYFPAAIVFGTVLFIVDKPGATFFLMVGYGFVSEFFSPSLLWFLYYIAWGGLLETYQIFSDSVEEPIDLFFYGLVFGSSGAGLSLIFILIIWGRWYPLWMSIPATLLDGILGGIGCTLSFTVGQTAQKITF